MDWKMGIDTGGGTALWQQEAWTLEIFEKFYLDVLKLHINPKYSSLLEEILTWRRYPACREMKGKCSEGSKYLQQEIFAKFGLI